MNTNFIPLIISLILYNRMVNKFLVNMVELLTKQEQQVRDLVTKQKKAKINWLLAITQLSLDELVAIAEKLHFIITSEYIALPSEGHNIHEQGTWKPLPITPPRGYYRRPIEEEQDQSLKSSPKTPKTVQDYRYCPSCGITLKDTGLAYSFEGFCQNCGEDLDKILEKQTSNNPYDKKRCARCGTINPAIAQYCYYCGFDVLETIL